MVLEYLGSNVTNWVIVGALLMFTLGGPEIRVGILVARLACDW